MRRQAPNAGPLPAGGCQWSHTITRRHFFALTAKLLWFRVCTKMVQKVILHHFVSGISCLIQKTQKNSSRFWVVSAVASVKKILPLSSRVAIPWVQRFGRNVPCQVWWPQLQARLWPHLSRSSLSSKDHGRALVGHCCW